MVTIDLTAQMQQRNESRAPGTIDQYQDRLRDAVEYFNDAGYSIEAITTHHPILIADFLTRKAIKSINQDTKNVDYMSKGHWYNSWSALSRYFNSFCNSGWPRNYEPVDNATIVDMFENTAVVIDCNGPSIFYFHIN